MELLGRCDEGQYFDLAQDLKLFRWNVNRLERDATLGGRANGAIVVLRKWDVTARSIVPVFQDLCLTGPNRIIGIPVSRNPNPDPDELKGEEEAEEYISFI